METRRVKGIILAGGTGSRLYPTTIATSKQLMTIYNKPLIYYPLSVLMLAGIQEVLIITTPDDQDRFVRLLGNGTRIGMSFSYAVQPRPEGLAQAFTIGRDFIGRDRCALILGDNIFYGMGLTPMLREAAARPQGCTIFAYLVKEPERYGIVEFSEEGAPIGIEEKPTSPKSHWAVTGLYFYDNRVLDIVPRLKPSARGELEITDVNLAYLAAGALTCKRMGRGFAWLDTGTPDFLLDAGEFVRTIENRQGLMIACIEEIAYRNGFIDAEQLLKLAAPLTKTSYGCYLETVAKEGPHRY
jgi:glucose-1-phosphate thymidylyltransferase